MAIASKTGTDMLSYLQEAFAKMLYLLAFHGLP
jgi:hypothetical protein